MDFIVYRFACFLGSRLPLQLSYFIARRVAELRYYSSFFYRKTVKRIITENLGMVVQYKAKMEGKPFSRSELTKTVKKSYYHFADYMTDFFNIPKWSREKVKRDVRITGLEKLQNAVSAGKGVIVLTCHLGNWELAGVVTRLLGFPINAIAFPFRTKNVARIFVERRERAGIKVIYTGSNPKEILKALKKNEIIAVLGDRVFTEKGVTIKFMGKPALLPRGPATLAVKTGAKYIAGFLISENGGYTLTFENFPEPAENLSEREKINFYTGEGVKLLEKYITRYPHQWLNFSPTWNIVEKN